MIQHSDIKLQYLMAHQRLEPYQRFRLLDEIIMSDGISNWIIPKGWCTDGASIPRALWWFASPFNGDYLPAAIIHDYLYLTQKISRARADAIFYTMMIQAGVGWLKATIMYFAVRMFGWLAWNKNRKGKK